MVLRAHSIFVKGGFIVAMGMETTGTPVIMTGNNDGMLGGGGIGSLLIGALLFGGGLGGFGNRYGNGGGYPVAEGAQLGQLAGIQTQLTALQGQVASTAIDAGLTSINQNISGTSRDQLQAINATQTAQAAANFTTLSSINGLGRDVTAQANQNALSTLNSFNQLNTSVLQGFNEVGRDNANAFNQVQSSLAAMAAQQAACCCDLKAAICADGQETRALINNLYVQNLQGQLADAKSQNNALNSQIFTQAALNAQAGVIINHLKPVPPVIA